MSRVFVTIVTCMGLVLLSACPSKARPIKDNANPGNAVSQPSGTTKSDGPKVVLVVANASLPLGQSTVVSLKNVGQQPYRYDFKGGNNGCVLPIYRMKLVASSGAAFTNTYNHSSRMCTMALVPPRTIVIPPGQARQLKLETGRVWFTVPKSMRYKPKRHALMPGQYKLWVTGGALRVSATITLSPPPVIK